jgi:subtilisin family serine protease
VGFANGTSFSAPQITALAAGLWQAKPEWTRAELIENILRSASQYENPDNLLGYGIPNFREALYGEILSVEENGEIIPWKVFPNPMQGNKLTIYFGSSLSAEFSLIDLNGKTLQNQSLSRNSAKDPYELQLEGIRPGMYIIQLQDGKLIKQQKLIRL